MEKTINGTTYKYQEGVFGCKILAYSNLGGVIVCNEELICDIPIKDNETFNNVCCQIDQRYN